MTSSVLNYRHENGRRYHGYRDGSYLLPNDEEEADRLDMFHEMVLTIMKRKLFLAPIGPSPQRVIDIGTGTGIWAIDFGKPREQAAIGIIRDLHMSQPTSILPQRQVYYSVFYESPEKYDGAKIPPSGYRYRPESYPTELVSTHCSLPE